MTASQQTVSRRIADFFSSLKLTIFLLIALSLLSIIGTVIPQGSIPPEYVQSISPAKLQLYTALGFFDMYHSWWFVLLLSLLSLNLIFCSMKRLPAIWSTITKPTLTMDENFEKTLANRTSIAREEDASLLKDRVADLLKNEFAHPVITEENSTFHLFAQKAPWARLAVYGVHLSILVIFIGAIIGSLFGYKGFVNIPEGEYIDRIVSRSQTEIPLGFGVYCQKFTVATYPNGAPKEFKSILTVLENGKPVAGYEQVPVIVNSPLSYKGITFYQSSYGKMGEHEFTISDPDGKNPSPLIIQSNGSIKLPDGSGFCLQETTPDISRFIPGATGPAAQVETHMLNGESKTFVVYSNNPALNRMNLPFTGGKLIQYKGGEEFVYTGLQVAKDPGVWVVWIGCILMVVGIYVAFFMSHRRIWVRITNGSICIAGNASKNQGGFQLFMERLVTKIGEEPSREEHS